MTLKTMKDAARMSKAEHTEVNQYSKDIADSHMRAMIQSADIADVPGHMIATHAFQHAIAIFAMDCYASQLPVEFCHQAVTEMLKRLAQQVTTTTYEQCEKLSVRAKGHRSD